MIDRSIEVLKADEPADALAQIIAKGLARAGLEIVDNKGPGPTGTYGMLVNAKGVKLMIGIQVCK